MTRYFLGLLSGLLIAGATGVCWIGDQQYTLEPVTQVTPTRISIPTSTPAPTFTPVPTSATGCVQLVIPAGTYVAIRATPSDAGALLRYARNETLLLEQGTGWVAICGGRGYAKVTK